MSRGLGDVYKRQEHTKLTLEKKILQPILPGFELATFRLRVRRSNQQAIPAPRSQSSQLAESLWTDAGLKSGTNSRELIFTKKKIFKKRHEKRAQAGNNLSNIFPKFSHTRKKSPSSYHVVCQNMWYHNYSIFHITSDSEWLIACFMYK